MQESVNERPFDADVFPEQVQDEENERLQMEATCRSGANWFFWIAALSIVNTAVIYLGSQWGFIIGLGTTQLVDGIMMALAEDLGSGALAVGFAINLAIAGLVALFGYLANQRYTWVFVLGMVLYAMDGLIFFLVGDWLSLGFHVFVLFSLWTGCNACMKLNRPTVHQRMIAPIG